MPIVPFILATKFVEFKRDSMEAVLFCVNVGRLTVEVVGDPPVLGGRSEQKNTQD